MAKAGVSTVDLSNNSGSDKHNSESGKVDNNVGESSVSKLPFSISDSKHDFSGARVSKKCGGDEVCGDAENRSNKSTKPDLTDSKSSAKLAVTSDNFKQSKPEHLLSLKNGDSELFGNGKFSPWHSCFY